MNRAGDTQGGLGEAAWELGLRIIASARNYVGNATPLRELPENPDTMGIATEMTLVFSNHHGDHPTRGPDEKQC